MLYKLRTLSQRNLYKEQKKGEEDMERQKKLLKSRVIKVGSEKSWDSYVTQAINQGCPVAVHFTAAWCTPSRAMSPFFADLAMEYKHILFLSVDVDEAKVGKGKVQIRTFILTQEVASRMDIKAMPTFVFMKDGAPNNKLVGANPVELRKRIDFFIHSIETYPSA